MATGFIAPVLLARKITSDEEFSRSIQTAFGSFGIAWRLLDDIKDIELDMMEGSKSSIYICLPEDIKHYWNKENGEKDNQFVGVIFDFVLGNGVFDKIISRICCELQSAASIADHYDMTELADEFRCLMRPLKNYEDT